MPRGLEQERQQPGHGEEDHDQQERFGNQLQENSVALRCGGAIILHNGRGVIDPFAKRLIVLDLRCSFANYPQVIPLHAINKSPNPLTTAGNDEKAAGFAPRRLSVCVPADQLASTSVVGDRLERSSASTFDGTRLLGSHMVCRAGSSTICE